MNVVLTGATNGIGKEIARALAQGGARLTLLARDEARGRATAAELGGADVVLCDLAELASVRAAAAQLTEPIDVLVLNAGVRTLRARTSADGFELMTATNHLGPFLLTNLILDRVRERIVVTASEAHRTGDRIPLERLGQPEDFGPLRSERPYGRSKLFNVLFTQELAERLDDGVTANCFCPGVVGTGLVDSGLVTAVGKVASRTPFVRRPEEGARMGVRLATDPDLANVTGRFFTSTPGLRFLPRAPARNDRDYQRALWERSAELVGL